MSLAAARNAHGTRALTRAEKQAVVRSRYKAVPSPETLDRLADRLAVGRRTVASWTSAIRETLIEERDREIVRLHVENDLSLRKIEEWLKTDGRWQLSASQIGRVLRDGQSAVIAHRMKIKQYGVVVIHKWWYLGRARGPL